jgi:hypothetical protein
MTSVSSSILTVEVFLQACWNFGLFADNVLSAMVCSYCHPYCTHTGPDREESLGRGLVVLKQMREAGLQVHYTIV